MRPIFSIGAMVAAGVAAPAIAAPVHLKCQIDQGGEPRPVRFVLDEEFGHVTLIDLDTGASFQMQGTFLADRVLASNNFSAYEINRVHLTIVRRTPMVKTENRGKCVVEQPPRRAF